MKKRYCSYSEINLSLILVHPYLLLKAQSAYYEYNTESKKMLIKSYHDNIDSESENDGFEFSTIGKHKKILSSFIILSTLYKIYMYAKIDL